MTVRSALARQARSGAHVWLDPISDGLLTLVAQSVY